jgi:hypothetical protein
MKLTKLSLTGFILRYRGRPKFEKVVTPAYASNTFSFMLSKTFSSFIDYFARNWRNIAVGHKTPAPSLCNVPFLIHNPDQCVCVADTLSNLDIEKVNPFN